MGKRNYTHYHKYITKKEIEELEEYMLKFASPSVRMSFYLMYGLGLRCGEAIRLNIKDIDFENGLANINATKQNKIIQRAIPSKLLLRLKTHCKQYKKKIRHCKGYICFAYGHGAKSPHLCYGTVATHFSRFRKLYDYNNPYFVDKNGKKIYRHATHVLRSYFITNFIKQASEEFGSNAVRLAQLTIGHKDSSTTMGYIRFPDLLESARKIQDRL